MKLPEDVCHWLARRYQNQHRDWLGSAGGAGRWPLEIALGTPTEQAALAQWEGVSAWQAAWQTWRGVGELVWCERRWRTTGTQRLPEKLLLNGPQEVAHWAGEAQRWSRASARHAALVERWPALAASLSRHFDMLAEYGDADFQRLIDMLSWIIAHPGSRLYPRQLPIAGLDSKWLESRKGLVADLVTGIRGELRGERDFFQLCGLKAPPELMRLRILDAAMRSRVGGLGDITAPWEQVAGMDILPTHVFIVENLQTGLAFDDLPGAVVIMRLGYGVEVLGRLPWLARARCLYWGDLDTHGFAILNRARAYLPAVESVLMDQDTLLNHREWWVAEKEPHQAEGLGLLSSAEQAVYLTLKANQWGRNVRLEQERIPWDVAWRAVRQALHR